VVSNFDVNNRQKKVQLFFKRFKLLLNIKVEIFLVIFKGIFSVKSDPVN
jgi:hypothetical protein